MIDRLMELDWIFLGTTVAKAIFAWGLTLGFILVNIFLERKICAFIQDRVGPNRANILGVRLFGFILNFADAVKLLFKEDIIPPFVNKFYYFSAPLIIMTVALMGMAVVPFADDLVIVGKIGGVGVHAEVPGGPAAGRHDRDAVELPAVEMAQAADFFLVIEVAAAPVAAGLRVRAELDHAERKGRSGERVSVAAGSEHRARLVDRGCADRGSEE